MTNFLYAQFFILLMLFVATIRAVLFSEKQTLQSDAFSLFSLIGFLASIFCVVVFKIQIMTISVLVLSTIILITNFKKIIEFCNGLYKKYYSPLYRICSVIECVFVVVLFIVCLTFYDLSENRVSKKIYNFAGNYAQGFSLTEDNLKKNLQKTELWYSANFTAIENRKDLPLIVFLNQENKTSFDDYKIIESLTLKGFLVFSVEKESSSEINTFFRYFENNSDKKINIKQQKENIYFSVVLDCLDKVEEENVFVKNAIEKGIIIVSSEDFSDVLKTNLRLKYYSDKKIHFYSFNGNEGSEIFAPLIFTKPLDYMVMFKISPKKYFALRKEILEDIEDKTKNIYERALSL
ncbi:MAG: hypothetical protein E7062_05090 [Spirochaetaceae bacterium]|nr:hypothetical protein [Spirochaetaceae bacterium]